MISMDFLVKASAAGAPRCSVARCSTWDEQFLLRGTSQRIGTQQHCILMEYLLLGYLWIFTDIHGYLWISIDISVYYINTSPLYPH
jgi:hypothetical protein